LVPSITESIAATRPDALIGATDWCTHPAGLDVTRIRGTKNPDCAAIIALSADIVIANMEENREIDVSRLRDAGVTVWVTRIETVAQAVESLRRMFTDALGWPIPDWLEAVTAEWAAPAPPPRATAAVAIWRDPWMSVGSPTFTSDLLARLGLVNAFDGLPERYPHVTIGELDTSAIDLVLLPDEPYVFTAEDGPEAFSNTVTMLVSGRLLTWYGPSLLTARRELDASISSALRSRARPDV
jgi:hypothetical protein